MRNLDPWEIYVPNVFDGRRYCVYFHYVDEVLFYVGSGQIARAFEFEPSRRCPAWQQFVDGRPVSVVLTRRTDDRNAARRTEYDAIRRYRPIGNEPLEKGQALDWRVVDHSPTPEYRHMVASIIDRFTVVRAEPGGATFPSVRDASKALGVSESAIHNSISGRYLDVRGYRFSRVEKILPGA